MSTPIKASTQEHLDIEDITNNIVLYKTGAASLVLRLNAVNFNLLSAQEQEAIIFSYAGLLNSLSFPIQILIRSQKKDISNYIKVIQAQEARQINPILKSRIIAYRHFIEKIVKERNVLDKKFYVIIPFQSSELGISSSAINPLAKSPQKLPYEKSYIIEKALNSLEPKRDHLMRQFTHLNLNPKQLSTQDLIQLFYNIYNPDSDETVQITNSQNYQAPITQAQETPTIKNIIQNPPSPPVISAAKTQQANPSQPYRQTPPQKATSPTSSSLENHSPKTNSSQPPATRQPQKLYDQ